MRLQSAGFLRGGTLFARFVIPLSLLALSSPQLKPDVKMQSTPTQKGKYPHLPLSIRTGKGYLKLLHKAKSRTEIMRWSETDSKGYNYLELSFPRKTWNATSHEFDLHGWIVLGTTGSGIISYYAYVFFHNPVLKEPVSLEHLHEGDWEMIYTGGTGIRFRDSHEIAFAFIDQAKARLVFANQKAEEVGSVDFAHEINVLRQWQIKSGKQQIKLEKESEKFNN